MTSGFLMELPIAYIRDIKKEDAPRGHILSVIPLGVEGVLITNELELWYQIGIIGTPLSNISNLIYLLTMMLIIVG